MFAPLPVERARLCGVYTQQMHTVERGQSPHCSSADIRGVFSWTVEKGEPLSPSVSLPRRLWTLLLSLTSLEDFFSKLWCSSFPHLVPIFGYPSCSLGIMPKNDNRKSLSWHVGLTLASAFKARIRTCDLHSQAPAFPEAKETDPRLSSLTHFQDKSSVPEIDGTLVGMLLASYPSASSKHYSPKWLALRDRHIALSVTQWCLRAGPNPTLSP